MKTITVTTPGGKQDFTGDQIETKPAGGTLRIVIDGQHVASYRAWDSWIITDHTNKPKETK